MKKLCLVMVLLIVSGVLFADGLVGSWVHVLNSDRSIHMNISEDKSYSFTVMFHAAKTNETTGTMEVTEDKSGSTPDGDYVVGKMLMTNSEGKEIVYDYVNFTDDGVLIVVLSNGAQQKYERIIK